MNIPYLSGQMSRLKLAIPDKARPLIPDLLLALDKDLRRSRKR
jgi:hypothetical protein